MPKPCEDMWRYVKAIQTLHLYRLWLWRLWMNDRWWIPCCTSPGTRTVARVRVIGVENTSITRPANARNSNNARNTSSIFVNCEPGLTVSRASSNASTNLTKTESIYVHGKLWRLDRPLNLHWSSCHDMYWLYFGFWSFAWFPHVVPSNLAHSSWFRFQATCQSPPVRQRTIERSFNRDKKLTKRKLKETDPVPCSISNPIRWILHFHHTKAQQLWSLVL